MIIRKLEYLIALAREGHFGRAAQACHVSQPTLSAALRQLEAELGVMVLKRSQRYSGLTERGERVLVFTQHMAVECEHLRRHLESRRGCCPRVSVTGARALSMWFLVFFGRSVVGHKAV